MCNVHIRTLLKPSSSMHHFKKGWVDEMLIMGKKGENGREWDLCQWVEKIGIVSVGAGKTL
jgi:hypothetical protein